MKEIGKLYLTIREQLGIEKVPIMLAEDETAIKKEVSYHQGKDELLGFCGRKTVIPSDHECMVLAPIVVGDDYEALVRCFEENEIGSLARVILINPLHPQLPRLPIFIKPTCNKFIHHTVFAQWEQLDLLYKEHVEGSLGPLIGHSSDGDSRRRKCMTAVMSSEVSIQILNKVTLYCMIKHLLHRRMRVCHCYMYRLIFIPY